MDAASLCRLVRATGGGRTTEEMRPDGRVGARCAYTPYSLRAASATLLFERRCRHPQGARYGAAPPPPPPFSPPQAPPLYARGGPPRRTDLETGITAMSTGLTKSVS